MQDEDSEWQERLSHQVRELSRAMNRNLQIHLMDHNVSHGYWPYLRVLWEKQEITQRELSELAGLSEPTTHTALNAMEKLGYVERYRLPGNNRKVFVGLTRKGKALKKKLVPLAKELNAMYVEGIPPADIAVFRRTIKAIADNIEQHNIKTSRTLPPLRRMV
jgi:DNA-binding MarR family transcriptional regulator